jgi:hypothetical protein
MNADKQDTLSTSIWHCWHNIKKFANANYK